MIAAQNKAQNDYYRQKAEENLMTLNPMSWVKEAYYRAMGNPWLLGDNENPNTAHIQTGVADLVSPAKVGQAAKTVSSAKKSKLINSILGKMETKATKMYRETKFYQDPKHPNMVINDPVNRVGAVWIEKYELPGKKYDELNKFLPKLTELELINLNKYADNIGINGINYTIEGSSDRLLNFIKNLDRFNPKAKPIKAPIVKKPRHISEPENITSGATNDWAARRLALIEMGDFDPMEIDF